MNQPFSEAKWDPGKVDGLPGWISALQLIHLKSREDSPSGRRL